MRRLGIWGKPSMLACLACCLSLTVNDALCDIYMFREANGTVNFSNVPTDARYVLAMRTEDQQNPKTGKLHGMQNAGKGDARILEKKFHPVIVSAAATWKLDPALLHAVIRTESGFNVNAVSVKGAMGLMQLMPETASRYGAIDPFDPEQNILAGAQYLSSLMQRFDNDMRLALAAYNSGEDSVVKYGEKIPPYAETRAYVPKVIGLYRKYQRKVW